MTAKINGKEISAPIWGGHRPALLAPWSEIKKLGFKKRDRSFGTIEDENGKDVQALFFCATKHCCSLGFSNITTTLKKLNRQLGKVVDCFDNIAYN